MADSAPNQDKVLVGAALVLALASAAVFGWFAWRHAGPAAGGVDLADAPYEAKAPDAPPVKIDTWAAPVAQSRGREWIYDTFTPPEIFYNTRSKQFTVKPPSSLLDEGELEAFGVELVTVKPEPFRLQLIGYGGSAGAWRGTFTNLITGETILAAAGRRLEKLAVTIKSLDVAVQTVRVGEGAPVPQTVATAVVLDEKAGREFTLTNLARVFTGKVNAFVTTGGAEQREVHAGDTFKLGEATYRIDKVQVSPPSIDVVKESPTLTQPDRRTLTPRDPEAEAGEREPGS